MRIAAALVLAPLAIAMAYAGGWWWAVLVDARRDRSLRRMADGDLCGAQRRRHRVGHRRAGAGHAAFWRWTGSRRRSSCWPRLDRRYGARLAAAHLGQSRDIFMPRRRSSPPSRCGSTQTQGFAALILVLLVVWATDIGGYFAGRGIGGPKLWPRVSPNKTWAGAIGGFVGKPCGCRRLSALGHGKTLPLLVLAAALSIAAQFGDLFESAVKRRFRGQGFKSHNSRPRRANGPPGRLCRGNRARGDFRIFARRRGWRRPSSYGLVKHERSPFA